MTMKVVINSCVGGFSLSPKAVQAIAAKKNRPCYFFESTFNYDNGRHHYVRVDTTPQGTWTAFDVPEFLPGMGYEDHYLPSRPDNRHDADLIAVVEELGPEANGSCAKLKIVNIPDGVDYIIQSGDDGREWIAEKHRTWD